MIGQIYKQLYVFGQYSDGFFLATRIKYDDTLPILDETLEIGDIDLLSHAEMLSGLPGLFPETIPQGTEFTTTTGSTWTTLDDATIKEYVLKDYRKPIPGEDSTALVWGSEARYSYIIEDDPSDSPGAGSWRYPGGTHLFVPEGDWDDGYPSKYWQWTAVGYEHSSTGIYPPYGLFLTPDTLDAYNTIAFSDGAAAAVTGDNYSVWTANEGKLPLEVCRDVMDGFGFSTNLYYSGGIRFLDVWVQAHYGPSVEPYGFRFPFKTSTPVTAVPSVNPVVHMVAFASALAAAQAVLSLGNFRLCKVPNLHAIEGEGFAADGRWFSADSKHFGTV